MSVFIFPRDLEASELENSYDFISETVDYSYIIMNEVMPDPEGSDTDYEWIELYNLYEEEIDLASCTIDSKSFPVDTVIDGESYLLLAKDLLDSDGDGQSFEQHWGDDSGEWGDHETEDYKAVQVPISMKNSHDSIIFECVDYEDLFSWEISESGVAFSRDTQGEWTSEYDVTPGSENKEKPVVNYNHNIIISEVYPSPHEDECEWIELFNYDSDPIDLTDWILADNTKKQTFEEIRILSGKHLVLKEEHLNLTLNNSGEKIKLIDPNGDTVDVFDYISTPSGISNIHKFTDKNYTRKIYQSRLSTEGTRNKFIDISNVFYGFNMISINKLRSMDLGDEYYIEGCVTVKINMLGAKLFYIDDNTAGIQIYLSDEDMISNLTIGTKLKVLGDLKETYGELRLYVKDKYHISKIKGTIAVNPLLVKTGQISEQFEGRVVSVAGKIVETSGKTFYVDDGSGSVKVMIKSSTSIETPSKKKGQYAAVVGIVSQYGDDSYRVLPVNKQDIVISNEPIANGAVLALTGEKINKLVLFGFILFVLFVQRENCLILHLHKVNCNVRTVLDSGNI